MKKEVTVEGDDEKAGTNGVEKETIKVENNEVGSGTANTFCTRNYSNVCL